MTQIVPPKLFEVINTIYKNSLIKNSVYLISNVGFSSIIGFAFWIIASRLYNVEDIGIATTLIALVSLIVLLSNLGFSASLMYYIPKQQFDNVELINSVNTVTVIISSCISLAFISMVGFYSNELIFIQSSVIYVLVFLGTSITSTLCNIQLAIFIGERKSEYELVKNVIANVAKVSFLLVFISFGALGIFLSFGLSAVVAFLIGSLVLLPKAERNYLLKPHLDLALLRDVKKISLWNYIADVLMTGPGFLFPIIITYLINPSATGYFYVSWLIVSLVMVIPIAVSNSFLSEGSRGLGDVAILLKRSLIFTFILILPIIGILLLFGETILTLFGTQYASNSIFLLQILAVSCIPFAYNRLYISLKRIQMQMGTVIIINSFICLITFSCIYLSFNALGVLAVPLGWTIAQVLSASVIIVSQALKSLILGKAPPCC